MPDGPCRQGRGFVGSVVAFEREKYVVLTLTSEGRGNAVDRVMLLELEERLQRLSEGTRAVLLRGAGEKSFCTGYDIEELVRELAQGPSVTDEAAHPLEKALRALDECPVPTIAAHQ